MHNSCCRHVRALSSGFQFQVILPTKSLKSKNFTTSDLTKIQTNDSHPKRVETTVSHFMTAVRSEYVFRCPMNRSSFYPVLDLLEVIQNENVPLLRLATEVQRSQ